MVELQQMIESPQWAQRSEAKAALKAEVEELLNDSPAPSPRFPWAVAAAFLLGLGVGVAIAVSLF